MAPEAPKARPSVEERRETASRDKQEAPAASAEQKVIEKPDASNVARAAAAPARGAAGSVTASAAAAPAAPPAQLQESVRLDAFAARSRALAAIPEVIVVSSNPSTRFRLLPGGAVQRSADAGSTWRTEPTGATERLTAGASPSPSVCWLVGGAGTVLLSTDGRSWRRVAFPEAVDLRSVTATDQETATVTTADGRVFRHDRWRPDLVAARPGFVALRPDPSCKESRRLRSKGRTTKEPFHADTNRTDARGRLIAAARRSTCQAARRTATPQAARGEWHSLVDARRPGRTGRHRLQLGHRARPRRPRICSCREARFDLRFMDIAATVNPATVHFRSLTEPSRVNVLEQNYEYDLLEPDKLLRKYVGRDVTLVRRRSENGETREEEVKARLLSYNNAPVWQIGGEIVTGLGADHIKFPELPGNLYTHPTLIWTLDNSGAHAASRRGVVSGEQAVVERRLRPDRRARRQGRRPRRLGDARQRQRHVVPQHEAAARRRRSQSRPSGVRAQAMDEAEMSGRAAAAPMAQESFSDYHLYTLGRKTTINNNETKQVSMLNGTGVPVQQALRRRRPGVLLPEQPASRIADQGRGAGLSTSSRTRNAAGSACRCRRASSACIRPTRKAARSSWARIASATRRRTRS